MSSSRLAQLQILQVMKTTPGALVWFLMAVAPSTFTWPLDLAEARSAVGFEAGCWLTGCLSVGSGCVRSVTGSQRSFDAVQFNRRVSACPPSSFLIRELVFHGRTNTLLQVGRYYDEGDDTLGTVRVRIGGAACSLCLAWPAAPVAARRLQGQSGYHCGRHRIYGA